ncbi:MAG: hypothetical protein ACXWGX_10495 [Usitatibacter sp.]
MEAIQIEVARIQIKEFVFEVSDDPFRNLLEVRLAFAGGGMADTVPI